HLFEQAGWQKLEGFWVEGITKAVSDLGNSTTPISTRYLFGRSQDFAYQGGDSTIDHRHHIRLWKEQSPDGTLVYYATASYDRMIGFAPLKFLFKPTHIIAPNIDDERDLLGGVFASHSPKMTTYYVTNLLPKLFRSNGNNAWFYTDGDVLVFTGENATKRGLTMLQKAKHGYFHFLSYPLKLVNIAQ
ncbi:MAG: LssY C-terminal domain-containing protein, partial [Candidatus Peribacteraceae bacterium]